LRRRGRAQRTGSFNIHRNPKFQDNIINIATEYEGSRPDREKARKWEKKRSHKQTHIHQPLFMDNTINNETVNGGTIVAGTMLILRKRKRVNYAESATETETEIND